MLIFLAGLQSISPTIYESCQIDGATSWETFWKITFPMISPMILVNAVYTVIDSFTTDSNTIMKFISNEYLQPDGKGTSTAMAWMYFLIVIAMVGIIAAICSAFVKSNSVLSRSRKTFLIIQISIPPPLAGGTNSNESVSTLYVVL